MRDTRSWGEKHAKGGSLLPRASRLQDLMRPFCFSRFLFSSLTHDGLSEKGTTRNLHSLKQSAAASVAIIPPAVPSTIPTHEHFSLSSFAPIKRPRWWPVELSDRHVPYHDKIGVMLTVYFILNYR